jgi:hypothetical protein
MVMLELQCDAVLSALSSRHLTECLIEELGRDWLIDARHLLMTYSSALEASRDPNGPGRPELIAQLTALSAELEMMSASSASLSVESTARRAFELSHSEPPSGWPSVWAAQPEEIVLKYGGAIKEAIADISKK